MASLIAIGQPAPGFELPDLRGQPHALKDYRGRIVVVNFWSAECPHVARTDRHMHSYLETWGDAVVLLPIAANVNEPVDLLKRVAAERGLPLVLHDSQRHVADLYEAETTPHLFVMDSGGTVRYQGAFDDVTFRNRTPSQFYLQQAVEALLAGGEPDPAQTQPYGCTIVRFEP